MNRKKLNILQKYNYSLKNCENMINNVFFWNSILYLDTKPKRKKIRLLIGRLVMIVLSRVEVLIKFLLLILG